MSPKTKQETVRIYESKTKLLLLCIAGLVMTMGSLYIGVMASRITGFASYLLYFISVCGILFFGYATIHISRQIFKKHAVLILNSEGFINRKQMYTIDKDLVPWSQVKRIRLREIVGETFVCIEIEDEAGYLAKMSKVMNAGAKANIKLGFPAITISAKSLMGYDDQMLYELFTTYSNQY